MVRKGVSLVLIVAALLLLLPQSARASALTTVQKQDLAEKVARQIVAGMPSWVDTDEEKVLYLYDYMTETVTYQFNNDDQTPYGALVKGLCVCAGYANGFELLLETAGIEAGSDTGYSTAKQEGHQWNYLYIGGQKLYADVTWGDRDYAWSHIPGNPEKLNHYGLLQTEKEIRESHAEYIFADGVYDGSGEGAAGGSGYTFAAILERSGVPVGRFNRETRPEEVLPYFRVLHYDGTNALIRAVYYYDEVAHDYNHSFAADRAAEMLLDSVTESHTVIGPECEAYYWGPISNYNPIPAQSVVLRTGEEREIRKDEIMIVTAEVLPYEAANKQVAYSSSDPSVATVDRFGKVTGVSEGTAVITATSEDGGYTDSITITVASDHYHDSWLENILEKSPTCEEPGCKMYFRCQSCGAWFPDYWGSAEIVDHNSWLIPALGHVESPWMSDAAGHWKQCTRSGCGKLTQTKTAHSDSNGDGICDLCSFRPNESKPTQPAATTVPKPSQTTTVPTETTVPPTVPAGPAATTQSTTSPISPTVSRPVSAPATKPVPGTTPETEPPTKTGQWILWGSLGLAAAIPVMICFLRKKRK